MRRLWSAAGIWSAGSSKDFNSATAEAFRNVQVPARLYESRRLCMWLRFIGVSLLAVAFCSADTLTLRSGRVITGQYLGGDARHIRMAVGDRVDTFSVQDVGDVESSGEARQSTP